MPPLVRCHSLFHPKKTNTFGVSINVHGLCNWWVHLYVGIAISSAELWFRFTKDLAFVEFPRARLTWPDSTNNQQIMPSVNITFVSRTSWGLKLNESSSSSPGKYNNNPLSTLCQVNPFLSAHCGIPDIVLRMYKAINVACFDDKEWMRGREWVGQENGERDEGNGGWWMI